MSNELDVNISIYIYIYIHTYLYIFIMLFLLSRSFDSKFPESRSLPFGRPPAVCDQPRERIHEVRKSETSQISSCFSGIT